MERFLYATARDPDPIRMAEEVAARLTPLPARATLGFIYYTDRLSPPQLESLLLHLRRAIPQVDWVGTGGAGVCATGEEIYDEPALAVMVTDIPRGHYRLLPPLTEPGQLPPDISEWCAAQGLCFGLLHADPGQAALTELVEEVASAAPAGFMNGGLTASNSVNHQVVDGILTTNALSGVLLGAEVEIATDHTQGCTPFGEKHLITEAKRNILIQLDHRPALDVMKETIGEVLARDLAKIGGYIFVGLPIPSSDMGDYLVRNLLAVDTRQKVIAVADYLEEGAPLIFCRRDGNTAREDLARMLGRLRQRLGDRPIRGGVYISCGGRGRNQFGEESQELKAIREGLGDFPLVGFFANGELYNGRLYGYTGVLSLFL